MGDVLLNGRVALDWELPAVEHGRQCDRERDLAVLGGLLSEYPRQQVPVSRPVTDVFGELP
jgi:hypothetical protein